VALPFAPTAQMVRREEYFVYMLLCADDSFYVGVTNDVEGRVWQHNAGEDPDSYTCERRPVELVYCSGFSSVFDAIRWEKQLKGLSRAKKRALMRNDWQLVHEVVCKERRMRESRES
jgi:putative endonuclease